MNWAKLKEFFARQVQETRARVTALEARVAALERGAGKTPALERVKAFDVLRGYLLWRCSASM